MLQDAPIGYKEIVRVFGDCDDPKFEAKNIVIFPLPYPLWYDGNQVLRSRCHKLLVENFTAVFEEIKEQGFTEQVKNYAGIYNKRPIRGRRKPSTHSFGIAIDIEPSKYPLGSAMRFPQEIVDIWRKYGFHYGGDFKNRRDPMHFQFAKGY